MQAYPGTYALIMICTDEQQVEIGKLGRLNINPGCYVYVGSAFGPGGLNARIAHHAKISVRPYWHIDYLRPMLDLRGVCYSDESERHEHQWAGALQRFRGATIPMTGFGSSDCSCRSHLFRFNRKPSDRLFRERLNCHLIHNWQPGPVRVNSSPFFHNRNEQTP